MRINQGLTESYRYKVLGLGRNSQTDFGALDDDYEYDDDEKMIQVDNGDRNAPTLMARDNDDKLKDMFQKRSKKRILFVDDEESIRQAVGHFLFDKGFQVMTAPDAQTALRLLERSQPTITKNSDGSVKESDYDNRNSSQRRKMIDLLVSDIRMPGPMDGLDLLLQIRANPNLVSLPVILLTAKGQTKDRVAGYQAGVDIYLPKPFQPEELLSMIDGLLERFAVLNGERVSIDDLQGDLEEIQWLLLKEGGGGSSMRGWVEDDGVFLTQDERRVLQYLCDGLQNKAIANALNLRQKRVEQLLSSMYRKTQTANRTSLVRWAISSGQVKLL